MRRSIRILLIVLALGFCCEVYTSPYTSTFKDSFDSINSRIAFPYKNEYEVRSFEDKIELYGKATKVPVLMYHHILEAKDKKSKNGLILTTGEFQRQMEYLYRNDYTTITVRELELFLDSKLVLPKKSVLIIFDDGYKSVYKYAYPILQDYGFKATVALIPKYMTEKMQWFNPVRLTCLSWQEVNLGNDVFEYINHTYSHASMKEISYSRALTEIKKVNDKLQSKYFVYPIGHTSLNSERALKALGYKLAFTTKPGLVTKTSRRLYLPRQRVSAGMTLKSFASLLQ